MEEGELKLVPEVRRGDGGIVGRGGWWRCGMMLSSLLFLALIAVGLAGLIGTWGPFSGARGGLTCTAPVLPGKTVDVNLSDMGGMMGSGQMLSAAASPSTVAPGDVSFIVRNAGMMVHEFVVLPLPPGEAGSRPVGADGRVSEAGSLGEASASCTEGTGDGIAPGSVSWVTLHMTSGRYELICNEPGHYAAGMFTELDVR